MWRYVTLFAVFMLAMPVQAAEYQLIRDESHVQFSGTHAGNEFTGEFTDWTAQITFDPDDLTASRVNAKFQLESATTGNKMYDGTLPKSDWFDIENHPTAIYAADKVTQNDGGGYTAHGQLTIRGITHDQTLTFTINDLSTDPVVATGQTTIDRLKYNIGKQSDPNAEWVSGQIQVNIKVTAQKLSD
jgi:cytochrome b561